MFRLVCFCEDKDLATTMRSLASCRVRDLVASPVVNVEVKNGKLQAPTNGTLLAMLSGFLDKRKIARLSIAETREFLSSVGRGPQSASYVLKQAVKAGVLVKRGRGKKSYYERKGRTK